MPRKRLDLIPKSAGQIDNDWFGRAPHDDPLEGKSFRRIDFLVGKPRRHIKEIARLQGGIELSLLAPPYVGSAAKHVRDRVLLTVMVDYCAGSRFNQKDATPHRRVDAGLPMNGCETL